MKRVSIADIKNNNNVKEIDSDAGLTLYCYDTCTNDSAYEYKASRGVVFKGEKLIFQGLPYTDEYVVRDGDTYGLDDFENTRFFNSYEGCLLRAFHNGGKWYITTHKKLDACNSRWASRKSYGELFHESIDWDTVVKKLKTSCGYLFLLENNHENRLVCNALDKPNVFHVGTIDEKGQLIMSDDIGVKKPSELNFNNVEELNAHIRDIDYMNYQGVIAFRPDGTQCKIYNDEYKSFLDARGNESSIRFRYIQVRNDPDKSDRLRYLYKNQEDDFNLYENLIRIITEFIYNSYVERFIYKQYKRVPKDEYKIIQMAHTWHLSNRDQNKISLHKIQELLNEQSPIYLNRIIKRLKKFGNYDNYNGAPKYQQDTKRPPSYIAKDGLECAPQAVPPPPPPATNE